MEMVDIIVKKRDGGALSRDEIRYFIREYVAGNIPDYQASALLMAIYFQGMNEKETFELTDAMEHSGDEEDLSMIPGIKVDKHSTGGVGDKTTLIAAPVAAAAGVPVAKMSGRGLGFTGGTADKLEAIPGYQTQLDPAAFRKQVRDIGISVITQTRKVTPADKKLYALRDVTGTVENPSLIASSIMSKKLASGSDAIVLDVKCGNGAFLKTKEAAEGLARLMISIGTSAGRRTAAVISDMNEPLGFAVGNSLEVMEAIDVLKGHGPSDITQLSLELAAAMILLGEKAAEIDEARSIARRQLESGAALEKLRQMIAAQGGDAGVIEDYTKFGRAAFCKEVRAASGGYVTSVNTEGIGMASQRAGAGRLRKEDPIDLTAGIRMTRKIGDAVSEGDVLATVYGNDRGRLAEAVQETAAAFIIGADPVKAPDLIKEVIGL